MALNPSMIELAIEAQRDMIYLFFCGLLIYFLACGIRRQKWFYWASAGVFFACSFLTRYETLEFVPLIAFYLLFLLIAKYMPWKKFLLNASVFLAITTASLFPADPYDGSSGASVRKLSEILFAEMASF